MRVCASVNLMINDLFVCVIAVEFHFHQFLDLDLGAPQAEASARRKPPLSRRNKVSKADKGTRYNREREREKREINCRRRSQDAIQ